VGKGKGRKKGGARGHPPTPPPPTTPPGGVWFEQKMVEGGWDQKPSKRGEKRERA